MLQRGLRSSGRTAKGLKGDLILGLRKKKVGGDPQGSDFLSQMEGHIHQ